MLKVSVAGCSLCDYIYPNIDFNSPGFKKYMSKVPGDGGIIPGQLVFAEELEIFSGERFKDIVKNLVGSVAPTEWSIGGPAVVAGITASELLEAEGYEVNFFGARGGDESGDHVAEILKKTPMNFENYKTIQGKTPFTWVLSDPNYNNGKGEKIFINNIGSAWYYTPDMLGDDFYDASVLVLGGTALMPELHDHLNRILLRGLEEYCFNIVTTVFDFRNEKENPGHPWDIGESEDTYRYMDLLIVDWVEAMKMTGSSNLNAAAYYFKAHGVSAFIITNGPDNFYIWSSGRSMQPLDLSSLPVCKAVDDNLTEHPEWRGDDIGCGDNFCGGVVAGICEQIKNNPEELPDLLEAAAWGAAAGGCALFRTGPIALEQKAGAVRNQIEPYYQSYLKQIGRKR